MLETIGEQVRSYNVTDKGEFRELEAFLKQRREAVFGFIRNSESVW